MVKKAKVRSGNAPEWDREEAISRWYRSVHRRRRQEIKKSLRELEQELAKVEAFLEKYE
jgi:hypothetical protein